ncbi:hypothetical protein GCM10009547_49080 [Sporichthya brevicatena]|uniref:Urease accessory protein n=2 Tax=Sporichthya brevicatena TaxID=171442 RepID=A0ABN1HD74_9ACTN
MIPHSVAAVVASAGRRFADRGGNSLRLEVTGRLVTLRGPERGDGPEQLLEAGIALFDLRVGAEERGMRAEVAVLPPEDLTAWATVTLHPRALHRDPGEIAWPARPRLLGVGRSGRRSARELVAACERGAASEGIALRVAPMPLPTHVGLTLRARGDDPAHWIALGQCWAGIARLADRCGWIAHLRTRPGATPTLGRFLGAQVEVWLLARETPPPGRAAVATDEWFGF